MAINNFEPLLQIEPNFEALSGRGIASANSQIFNAALHFARLQTRMDSADAYYNRALARKSKKFDLAIATMLKQSPATQIISRR